MNELATDLSSLGARNSMIHVETVDLSQLGITLPSQSVGMVISQPYLPDSSLTTTEPYQCTMQAKTKQLAALGKTLEVARAAQHGASKTHFTIFPEYSIPGLEGIALIETALSATNWPNGTVVIGGTDALTQAQYVQLLQGQTTHVDLARNGENLVQPSQWVNCSITWVKGGDGHLERWIQPKLHPAWGEMNISHQHMFRGSSVFIFKGILENGVPYRFGTLICFDWIANVGTKTPSQWILDNLHQQANGAQLPISWLFIIQRNPKPSHDTFLKRVEDFFNQTEFPNALRHSACLVFANTAGKATPGRTDEFGGCSVVASPQSLFQKEFFVPTYSKGGRRFRDNSNLLADYKDAFFRERGACIHSFCLVNPSSLIAGAAGRKLIIEEAAIFPLLGETDPRTPEAAVPACIKWLNDELDLLPRLAESYPGVPLAAQSNNLHNQIVTALREVSSQSVEYSVQMATATNPDKEKKRTADDWDSRETEALEHLVNTLNIIGLGFSVPTIDANPDPKSAHAMVVINNQVVDILAIRCVTHEMCRKHIQNFYEVLPRRNAIIISRDKDNTDWQKKFGSFLEPTTPQIGQGRDITDPEAGLFHLGYWKLLDIFRNSNTPADVHGAINATLAA